MNVLLIHNFYNTTGGEDVVVKNEKSLLHKEGHSVHTFFVDNEKVVGVFRKIITAILVHYSPSMKKYVKNYLKNSSADIVHVHNFFPRITPSIFDSSRASNVPTVMTLHNYRIVCPTSLLMHQGEICEKSFYKSAYWAVPYKVYRNSYVGTFVLSHMIEYHKRKKTWQHKVDKFICLTDFSRNKFIQAGLPKDKLVVKPNFCEDPGYDSNITRKAQCVYIGRLSEEKGINVLNEAWRRIKFPIQVIGEGDLIFSSSPFFCLKGRQNKEQVIQSIKISQFVVVPSVCYEGFPMAIVEAFACGTPVICSKLGSMEEIVTDGVTGLHFEAGNPKDLAEKVQWMVDNPAKAREMGRNARNEYLQKYTPERNYEMLMDIYQQAIDEAKKGNRHE